MRNRSCEGVLAALLIATPCGAAELVDMPHVTATRSSAVAGAYLRVPLGRSTEAAPRAGLRLAVSHAWRDPRSFAVTREANLLDLRLTEARAASLFVAGRPLSGPDSERMNAGGESKGRLDKIMIGAGIALGAIAAFFLVSSVAD